MSAPIPFQASLVNASTGLVDIQTGSNCSSLIINDDSNYGTNNSPSSAAANFSNYIVITVTHLPTGTTYVLQSYPTITPTPYLFQIPPPSSGTHSFTLPLLTGDGSYEVQLVTIPTYDPAQGSYVPNVSQVFYNGVIYTCIQAGAGHTPSTSPLYWTATTNIGVNYTDIQTIYVNCALQQCLVNETSDALCSANPPCNNLCNNQDFINTLLLMMAQYSISYLINTGQGEQTVPLTDLVNQICQCNPQA